VGDFKYFIIKLEAAVSYLFKSDRKLIACRDFNVDYISESSQKVQLNSLLKTCNVISTISIPRIQNNSKHSS